MNTDELLEKMRGIVREEVTASENRVKAELRQEIKASVERVVQKIDRSQEDTIEVLKELIHTGYEMHEQRIRKIEDDLSIPIRKRTNPPSETLHGLNPIIDFLEKIFYFVCTRVYCMPGAHQIMSPAEEETVAALTLVFAKLAELGQLNVREMLTPGRYDQYKATLDEAYEALVKIEDALDNLGMKLEYQHWRISSAFEELKPLFMQPRSLVDAALETFEQDIQRKERKFQHP